MVRKKLVALVATAVIGAALVAAPTLAGARSGGGGGGGRSMGGGGHAVGGFSRGGSIGMARVGGGSVGFARVGGGSIGMARVGALRTGPVGINRAAFIGHRPFFPHRRVFVGRSFVGYGLYAGYSCWRWVPTAFGPRRVWVCDDAYSYSSYY